MSIISDFCFGVEQEHPSVTLRDDEHPESTNHDRAYCKIQEAVRLSNIPYMNTAVGLFVPYGQVYLENTGKHVETAVIPCGNPDHALKNELCLKNVLKNGLLSVREQWTGLNLLKNNINYSNNATYGSHESYAIQCDAVLLEKALVPFLVTRQVFAGSGVVLGGAMGLSPRAQFMEEVGGGSTTNHRAIFSTSREEPLMKCSEFRARLHLIVGDGLMSQFGQWLKLGVTALVIRAAELDSTIGDKVIFASPVTSIKALSRMNHKGPRLLDTLLVSVQKHYLRAVSRMLDRYSFPDWCGEVVQAWENILRKLEKDPRELGTCLDPYIKLRLFEEYLHSRRCSWSKVIPGTDAYYTLALLDLRYHALVDGIFDMLDSSGILEHRRFADHEVIPGHEIEPFIPESLPREVMRARIIKMNSGKKDYFCEWTYIADLQHEAYLEMTNPLLAQRVWKIMNREQKERFKREMEFSNYMHDVHRNNGWCWLNNNHPA